MLVGNKIDLKNNWNVNWEEGEEFAKNHGYFFIETSALKNINVKKTFNILIIEALNEKHKKEDSEILESKETFKKSKISLN